MKTAEKRPRSISGEMRMENPGSGIPGIRDWTKRYRDGRTESEGGFGLGNTQVPHRSPILPRLR